MIHILGCGNPLMGDDGIGFRVIERLQSMHLILPDNVKLMDAGVCGLDLLNLLEGAERVIIIDAVKGAGDVGSVHRFGIDDIKGASPNGIISIHETCLADVLCIAEHVQKMPQSLTIYGIEVESSEDLSFCLSDRVQESIDTVIALILDELNTGIGS